MDQEVEDPVAIAVDILQRTGRALMDGDLDTFAACFCDATVVDTFDGRNVMSDRDSFRMTFDKVRYHFASLGVTDMDRQVVAAEYSDLNTITSSHETRLMRGTLMVQEPFLALSELVRQDGVWRIARSQYAIADSMAHNRALLGGRFTSTGAQHGIGGNK